MSDRPEKLYLSAPDADQEHEIWFDPDEGGTEYVRADLYAALEAQLAERGKTEREIEYDVYSKIRLAFRRALSELPEIAPLEISRVLSSVHMRDEFLNEGKRLQRAHGTDAVAPRVEQECGAGAWSFMRKGILSALEATPPAPKVTECATEGCEQAATVRFERGDIGSDYCHDCYMRIQTLTAAQEAGKP